MSPNPGGHRKGAAGMIRDPAGYREGRAGERAILLTVPDLRIAIGNGLRIATWCGYDMNNLHWIFGRNGQIGHAFPRNVGDRAPIFRSELP